jgi:hypothetical protein
MTIADLHIHTTASDGKWTVEKILHAAQQRGLSAIAITDHDTVGALQDIELKSSYQGEIIPGIEFNSETDFSEVHILGYHIDTKSPALQKILSNLRDSRVERVKEMIDKLKQIGYPLDFKDVQQQAGLSESLGRPHVAAALLEKGYISTFTEAFSGLIAKGGPAYVPHAKLSPVEAINTVRAAGGIPVLAHPGLIHDDNLVRQLILEGLMGLEAYHPTHDKATTNHYNQIAGRYNLLVTGGSDFHGIPGRYPEELGEFTIPYALVGRLNERHRLRI